MHMSISFADTDFIEFSGSCRSCTILYPRISKVAQLHPVFTQ